MIHPGARISDGLSWKSRIALELDHYGPAVTLRRHDEAQPHGVVDHVLEAPDGLPPVGGAAGDVVHPGHDHVWPLRRPPVALACSEVCLPGQRHDLGETT